MAPKLPPPVSMPSELDLKKANEAADQLLRGISRPTMTKIRLGLVVRTK